MARQVYFDKHEENLAQQFQKSIARQRSVIRLQTIVRSFIACRRVARMKVAESTIVRLVIENIVLGEPTLMREPSTSSEGPASEENLAVGHHETPVQAQGNSEHPVLPVIGTNDLTAFVAGVALPKDKQLSDQESYGKRTPLNTIQQQQHEITSQCKLDTVLSGKYAKTPALVTSSTDPLVVIAVTLFNKDVSIGQALVWVNDIKKRMRNEGRTVELTCPLFSSIIVPVHGASRTSENSGSLCTIGTITFTVTYYDPALSICGFMWKVSESMLSNAWKKRYFALFNGELHYYNDNYGLESVKNILLGKNIVEIKDDVYKNRSCLKIVFVVDGKEDFWHVDFDEEILPVMKEMWMRRLYLISSVQDPLIDQLTEKMTLTIVKTAIFDSKPSPISAGHKTKVPVSKLMSIFK